MTEPNVVVVVDDANFAQRFRTAADQGVLLLLRCGVCGHYNPLSVTTLCVHCGSTELMAEPTSGQGSVLSHTYVARPSDSGIPRTVVFVELQEGPRLLGVIPAEMEVGLGFDEPLSFAYRDRSSGALFFDR